MVKFAPNYDSSKYLKTTSWYKTKKILAHEIYIVQETNVGYI